MPTTIQISEKLKKKLIERKRFEKETYEEVIWNLIEDVMEINKQTKKDLAQARAEIKAGKYHSLSDLSSPK